MSQKELSDILRPLESADRIQKSIEEAAGAFNTLEEASKKLLMLVKEKAERFMISLQV